MIEWFIRRVEQFGWWYKTAKFRLRCWFYHWITDEGGDVGIMVARFIVLLKYKDSTIVSFRWNRKDWKTFKRAGKWQGHETPDNPSSREVVLTNG